MSVAPRMQRLGLLFALALALVVAGSMSAPAQADTGGKVVYFVDGGTPYRADAAHASRHVALHTSKAVRDGVAFVQGVVPSPDHRRLAEQLVVFPSGGEIVHEVRVTDSHGRHAQVVWGHADNHHRTYRSDWDISGMAWAPGGHHLYFGSTRVDYRYADETFTYSSRLHDSSVARGRAGVAETLSGGEGLSDPTTNPVDGQLAAVRVTSRTESSHGDCTMATGETDSIIVVLDPSTGEGHDLLTVSAPPAGRCRKPVQDLAWSPDGAQIAFDQQTCCTSADLLEGEIDLVAADGSDGEAYRVAVPTDDRHFTVAPTWRNAHSLWFQRGVRDTGETDHGIHVSPNLYSVSILDGIVGALVQHTHTPKFPETGPSFG